MPRWKSGLIGDVGAEGAWQSASGGTDVADPSTVPDPIRFDLGG